jgi:membrane associated rhomboid family serine protease
MHQASVGFHCPECARKGSQRVYHGPAAMYVRPVVTQVLIAINVAVFLLGAVVDGAGAVKGETGRFGTMFSSVARLWQHGSSVDEIYIRAVPGTHGIGVGNGEWWRLVTSGFIHYGLLHLAMNMWALWILGRLVERLAGRSRFAAIYGVSLLAGSLGALLVTPDSFSAGASGAIFGLMGAVFLAGRAQGIALRDSPLLNVLIINLVITFAIPGISIGGHLGGLAGGAVSGWVFFDLARRPGVDKRLPWIAAAVVAVACVGVAIVFASGHLAPLNG